MTTIPQVGEAMQQVLIDAAHQANAKLHYTRRPDLAKLSADALVQTQVLGGFYDLNVFARLSDAGVYWLSKLEPTALVGHTPD